MRYVKKLIATLLVLALVMVSPVPIHKTYAEEGDSSKPVELETQVEGVITATVINVSVPTTLSFSVDPNIEGVSYVASKSEIINNSNAPIKVLINAGNNFRQDAASLWKPVDYLPEDKEWDKLGKTESENSLALGIKIVDPVQWLKVFRDTPLYVVEQQAMTESVIFGEIGAKSSAEVTFDVRHGYAFSEPKTCTYNIVWYFTLAD